jgi:PIN domain nuclease of toxin-antitoxin system
MKLLLDTQIWIWFESRPEKLGRSAARQLDNPHNELYLSPVSIWEAGWTERRGRWKIKKSFAEWLDTALTRVPLREAPFNFEVATEAAGIQLPESDPGDVFIAATARVLNLTLVTADSQLIACSWLKTLANE